ncbi:CAP domain-containing protein [Thermicanus aegyptius]|uniref:CAP domain-containing protein n=1 Tax=Thermicanus aegyptius TaxID=94009 RepID=UPI00041F50E3|nr:CAP domain-containing protein [Thermicanus aegyptius]
MRKFFLFAFALTLVLGSMSFVPVQASAESDKVMVDGFEYPKTHLEALEYYNEIRRNVGVQEVKLDPYLTKAAENHANYLYKNKGKYKLIDGHFEDSKRDGFTGERSWDRAYSAGLDKKHSIMEAIHFGASSIKNGIDYLINAPGHRNLLLNYSLEKIGFAIVGDIVVIDVAYIFKPTDPPAYTYPYDGQTDVDISYWGREIPNPVEEFGLKTSGFIITFNPDQELGEPYIDSEDMEPSLVDSKGNAVPFYFNKYAYIIPKEPLKYGETYTVNVKYTKGRSLTWSFTTKKAPVGSNPDNPKNDPVDLTIAKGYADFQENKYWSENMAWAIKEGLIAGYEEKNPKTGKVEKLLKPQGQLSEAQFLTILFRYSESSEMLITTPKDPKWWASVPYQIAEKLGVPTKGSLKDKNKANAPMTRGEMAVILASYYNIKYNGGKALNEREAVQMMYDMGLSNGYPDANGNTPKTYESYGTKNILLREHVVTFMRNYDNYLKNKFGM